MRAAGAWAYRPTATARHDAVADHATNADQHDTFTVTVSDNDGGATDIPVTVSLTTMMTVPSYAVTARIPVGVTPVGMAISPWGDYVYVTSFVDHAAVTVLRTADATTTTIPLTFRPEGIVVGADGRHLYVADPTGNRIAVIDTTDRSTVFVPVGNKPFRMALCGADLYVANNQDGTVSVIDTIEAILTRTIAVGGHPYAIAAGGGRVYVTDYSFYGGQSTHSLSVIDAAGGVVVDSIPVGYYPTGIAMSPNGRRCYVSNDEGSYTTSHPGTTTVIDTVTNTVVETLPVGGNSIAVGEGGVEIYVVSHCRDGQFTSTLSTIDTITGGVTGVLINGMPDALAAHEDRIYLTDPWHSSVLQVSARSTLVVDTDTANGRPALTITRIAGDDETVVRDDHQRSGRGRCDVHGDTTVQRFGDRSRRRPVPVHAQRSRRAGFCRPLRNHRRRRARRCGDQDRCRPDRLTVRGRAPGPCGTCACRRSSRQPLRRVRCRTSTAS